MLHEFGHVLGLQHDGGHGLMSAAARVATLYSLSIQELKWCGEPPASR